MSRFRELGSGRLRERLPERMLVGLVALAVCTAVAGALEALDVPDSSIVYLAAVVLTAARYGTVDGIVMSVLSVATYDLLFTEPRFSLTVADPQEWISLVMFLGAAMMLGGLTARTADRARESEGRAREAASLFAISRALATLPHVREASREIVERLRAETDMERVWITVGAARSRERILADTASEVHAPLRPWCGASTACPGRSRRSGPGRTSAAPRPPAPRRRPSEPITSSPSRPPARRWAPFMRSAGAHPRCRTDRRLGSFRWRRIRSGSPSCVSGSRRRRPTPRSRSAATH